MGRRLQAFSEWLWNKTHPESPEDKLRYAKAELAYVKQLPDSDFTVYGFPHIDHGVDRKERVIARLKAKIAKLESSTKPTNKE